MLGKNCKSSILLGFRAKDQCLYFKWRVHSFIHSLIWLTHISSAIMGQVPWVRFWDGDLCAGVYRRELSGTILMKEARSGWEELNWDEVAKKALTDRDFAGALELEPFPSELLYFEARGQDLYVLSWVPHEGGVTMSEMVLFHWMQFSEGNPIDMSNFSSHWGLRKNLSGTSAYIPEVPSKDQHLI